MEILHAPPKYPPSIRSTVTIGNFDGIHLGHREILINLLKTARQYGSQSVVMTFQPHPMQVLFPPKAPRLITSAEHKRQLIEQFGIDVLLIMTFDHELSLKSGEAFIREILVEALRVKHLFLGENFVFGHHRTGNVALLQNLSRECDYIVHVIPPVEVRGTRVSSTWIRQLIQDGKVSAANRLLGRYYSVHGEVVQGQGLGRKFLFPTLNLDPSSEILPKNGVYVTRTFFGGREYSSVTNIGTRPTVAGIAVVVESHLLDVALDKAPASMEIQFLHRLRDEQKFPSLEALKAQITCDCKRSSRFFSLLEKFRKPQAPGRKY